MKYFGIFLIVMYLQSRRCRWGTKILSSVDKAYQRHKFGKFGIIVRRMAVAAQPGPVALLIVRCGFLTEMYFW